MRALNARDDALAREWFELTVHDNVSPRRQAEHRYDGTGRRQQLTDARLEAANDLRFEWQRRLENLGFAPLGVNQGGLRQRVQQGRRERDRIGSDTNR